VRKTGLFGGSFNPIHNCHIKIAGTALSLFNLDSIIFLPAGISPLKAPGLLAGKKHRLNMLKLALEGNKKFHISTFELNKCGKSYTIETLRYFQSIEPETNFNLIMGEDSFQTIDMWNSYNEILNAANIIVYPRENSSLKNALKRFPKFKLEDENNNYDTYKNFENRFIYYIKAPELRGSSTEIRLNINELRDKANLLPENVLLYIKEKKLYS